ncbi:uncharacterized protein LOC119403305 isoform X2 [Rhipicephalus sanguineus]|uniref:uncharacterized protein LOC119403305 isoform X2 n=1 Tax=Rhipicephalus sanguineus TaxID=34632 RepID=UPI0020C2260D|nr:uncharacterized protein LOC119403305 isoform X2 [Rhipicephalus sanguineus]
MEDNASGLRIGDYHRSHHSGHAQQATGHSGSCASCNHVSSHEFTSAELELTDSLRSHLGLNLGSDLRGKTAELEAVWPCSRRDRCPSTPCDSFGTAGYQTVSLREFKMAATERVSPGTSCVSPAFRLRHDQVTLQFLLTADGIYTVFATSETRTKLCKVDYNINVTDTQVYFNRNYTPGQGGPYVESLVGTFFGKQDDPTTMLLRTTDGAERGAEQLVYQDDEHKCGIFFAVLKRTYAGREVV